MLGLKYPATDIRVSLRCPLKRLLISKLFIVDVFGFIRNCSNSSQADQIETYKKLLQPYKYAYYTNGKTSCFQYSLSVAGFVEASIVCFCNTDKCNGNIPPNSRNTPNTENTKTQYTMNAEINTPARNTREDENILSAGYTFVSPTTRYNIPRTSFSTKPVSELATVVVAIIAAFFFLQ